MGEDCQCGVRACSEGTVAGGKEVSSSDTCIPATCNAPIRILPPGMLAHTIILPTCLPDTEVKNSSLSGDRTGNINVDMGGAGMSQIQYRVVSGDVIISERFVKHKYADPVQVRGSGAGRLEGRAG